MMKVKKQMRELLAKLREAENNVRAAIAEENDELAANAMEDVRKIRVRIEALKELESSEPEGGVRLGDDVAPHTGAWIETSGNSKATLHRSVVAERSTPTYTSAPPKSGSFPWLSRQRSIGIYPSSFWSTQIFMFFVKKFLILRGSSSASFKSARSERTPHSVAATKGFALAHTRSSFGSSSGSSWAM